MKYFEISLSKLSFLGSSCLSKQKRGDRFETSEVDILQWITIEAGWNDWKNDGNLPMEGNQDLPMESLGGLQTGFGVGK